MNHCVNCGMPIEDGAGFCPSCGMRVYRCGSCGAPQREENRFCSMCGAKMRPQAAPDKEAADAPAEVIAEEVVDAPVEASAEKVADAPVEMAAEVTAEVTAEEAADEPVEVTAEEAADAPVEEAADAPVEASALNEGDTQKIVLPPPAEMERDTFGADEQPSQSWYQRNRRPLLLGAIFVILIAVLSSWFFSRQMREDEYQERMTSICSSMTSIHQDVLRQMDMLDAKNRNQIAAQLTKRLDALRKIKDEHEEMRAPSSLAEENNKIAKILDLEERILSQIELYCREPLTVEPSEGRQILSDWTKEADELYRSVDLDAPFDKVPSLQRAVKPIYDMMETERKLEEQRIKMIEMRKSFVERMDVIISDYNAKKGDLSAILEAARSGDISSDSYRVRVANARSERETLRSRMFAIEVPEDAKPLLAQFNETLSLSIHCCDVMAELTNPVATILQGRDIYGEARAINSSAQESYDAFLEGYEAYKAADAETQNAEQSGQSNTAQ